MKRFALVGLLALVGTVHGAASIGLMTPGYTQTPVIPSTVVAGQVITARFDVQDQGQGQPIYWSIGMSALTDNVPSGSWDWVADEDGVYGVSKSTMKAACPTPGIPIPQPTPAVHPMNVAFMVPDYGPQAVTMALHVRVRQGPQAYCVADSELYKVFVVNPAPTPTVTRTPTRTATPAPGTSTPILTYTAGTPPTASPTPTSTLTPLVPSTPVPTAGPARPMVRFALPVPNPGPSTITFYVEGVADSVKVEFYSYGQTKLAEVERHMVGGWSSAPVPSLGHGGFLAKVTAFKDGAPTSFKIAYLYCI